MENILDFITLEVQNEHDLEHDLNKSPLYSEPKIYDADGDLNKRWYVYFSFVNPKTGKLKRMKNIYGKTNSQKTKEARYYLLSLYKRRLLKLLRAGYDPFADNTELYKKHRQNTATPPLPKTGVAVPVNVAQNTENDAQTPNATTPPPPQEHAKSMGIKEALDRALELKTNLVGERTLKDYANRCGILLKWLAKNHGEIKTIDGITKSIMVDFLNGVQFRTSPRNRNNYRTCFRTIFQVLKDNEIIANNFISGIPKLNAKPKINKTYSKEQQEEIFEHLEEHDPHLLLFVKFVAYNFLRPKEVCRLRIRDVSLKERTLQFRSKTKLLKSQLLPQIMVDELPDLSGLDGDLLLFAPDGIGGKWDTALENRRGYFTNRYKEVVKDHFGLGKEYTLYGFRHTFITKVYRSLLKEHTPFAAKSALMQITGHATMGALEKYLRDIDAELPEDYSEHLK